MAFLRFANAVLTHPHATQRGWDRIRTAAIRHSGKLTHSLVDQASEILGGVFNPDRYLLSHCTLVASLDTQEIPNIKTGTFKEGGRTLNRKYTDFRVTADTDKFLNNNIDGFERRVLLKSYRTLVGAFNFCEHVQIEDLSKGRVIDAIPRDIGDSIYVDILVATDRKHKELIRDVESGKMGTLSMGCSTETTTCTKCGNVAIDETDLCDCVKYAKGNRFIAEDGKNRRIGELCGHYTEDPTGGVTFIEASWVANPAFTGAVLRNVIQPEQVSLRTARRVQQVLSTPPKEWLVDNGMRKAASEDSQVVGRVSDRKAQFDFGDLGDSGDSSPEAKPESEAKPKEDTASPLDTLEEDVVQEMLNRVEQRIRKELSKKDKVPTPENSSSVNDNLLKEASGRRTYLAAVKAMTRTASSDADLMNRLAELDDACGIKAPAALYRAVLAVGPMKTSSVEDYLLACSRMLKRIPNRREAGSLVRLGRTLTFAEISLRNNPKQKHRSTP